MSMVKSTFRQLRMPMECAHSRVHVWPWAVDLHEEVSYVKDLVYGARVLALF